MTLKIWHGWDNVYRDRPPYIRILMAKYTNETSQLEFDPVPITERLFREARYPDVSRETSQGGSGMRTMPAGQMRMFERELQPMGKGKEPEHLLVTPEWEEKAQELIGTRLAGIQSVGTAGTPPGLGDFKLDPCSTMVSWIPSRHLPGPIWPDGQVGVVTLKTTQELEKGQMVVYDPYRQVVRPAKEGEAFFGYTLDPACSGDDVKIQAF